MSEPTAASPQLPLRHCYWVVPGLLLAGEHPGGPSRDKTKDRLKKLLAAGIECFVDLTKPTELVRYDTLLPFYVEYARKAIKDHGLPGSREQMLEILDYVGNAMSGGRPVYVHCRAGIGRTGTVIGCLLVERGLSGDGALDELNRLWQQSKRSKSWAYVPETEAQASYVREWKPGLKNGGFELNPLASAVSRVGPMSALDTRPPAFTVADVQSRAARQATGAGQARAALQNLAAGKGRTGGKNSGANQGGLAAAAAQARAAVERGEGVGRGGDGNQGPGARRAAAANEAQSAEPRRGAGAGQGTGANERLGAEPGPRRTGANERLGAGQGTGANEHLGVGPGRSAGATEQHGVGASRAAAANHAAPVGYPNGGGRTAAATKARAAVEREKAAQDDEFSAVRHALGNGQAPPSSPATEEDEFSAVRHALRDDPAPAPSAGSGVAQAGRPNPAAGGHRASARGHGSGNGRHQVPGPERAPAAPPPTAAGVSQTPAQGSAEEPPAQGRADQAPAPSHAGVGSPSAPLSVDGQIGPAASVMPISPIVVGAQHIKTHGAKPALPAVHTPAETPADLDPLLDPATLVAARALRERFVGTLFGLAVGDAVAAATQYRRAGSFTPVGDMIGGGPFDLPRGAWSDDTAMALCLAESLLECEGFDPRDQVQRYSRWQQDGYLSCTGQCVGITANTARSLALAKWRRVVFPGSFDPEQLDPEPLSRIAPIALYYLASLETTLQQAAESSRTTCQAPAVLDACRQFGRALHTALSGQPKARILADVTLITEADAHTNNTAAEALASAFWAFGSTDNFRDAVLCAANVGGNSDVVASVCGQLAGAHYGVSAIPPSWRNGLMQKDLIEGYADRLLAHGLVSLSR
ncbi:MAG: ADP-ribosylglycohydrolase family protein [Steroidobacteraceae bacterium]